MLQAILTRSIDLLFPPICLHCSEQVDQSGQLFCSGCRAHFELIDPLTRCPYCFCENSINRPCRSCVENKRWSIIIGSALDYVESVCTLVRKQKRGYLPYLAQTSAAFIVMQWGKLHWPKPDYVIPVPARSLFGGRNHAQLIAQEVSTLLEVPLMCCVKSLRYTPPQARLPKERDEEDIEIFEVVDPERFIGKTLLLIDDVAITGTTLRRMADALQAGTPSRIYALTLARAL